MTSIIAFFFETAPTLLGIALLIGALKALLFRPDPPYKKPLVVGLVSVNSFLLALVVGTDSFANSPSSNEPISSSIHYSRQLDRAQDTKGPIIVADTSPTFESTLPVEGLAPSLNGALGWLNSPPLKMDQLKGKVVLVDFWTYSCINCIRTLPFVRAWSEKYRDQGLVVIGVHTPEFAFEKRLSNLSAAIANFKIDYPVAIDSDFKIWRSFENSYWPAFYLIDARGRLRYHQFGEGNYQESESAIRDLLHEAGSRQATGRASPKVATVSENEADSPDVRSPETYVGYAQAESFASPGGFDHDRPRTYSVGTLALNQWGLLGLWTVGSDSAVLQRAEGEITLRFSARDLHLVAGPDSSGKSIRFRVSVDGKPPGENHGGDTDADGNGVITQTKLYQLVRQRADVKERTFIIKFLDAGAQAYVFTFG